MQEVAEPIDLLQVKKNATYSLPLDVWLWLKQEAERRATDASALIVDLVLRERERNAA